jgi:hypothetical protein
VITPLLGSLQTTGTVSVPLPGYGYALSGFDTITDFESGVDQIRLEGRLFSSGTNFPTPNAPGAFLSVASVTGTGLSSIVGKNELLIYARDTGILYGRAATASPNTAGAFGSQYVYNPTPVPFAGTFNPINGTQGGIGTEVLINSGTSPGTSNTVVIASYFILPQTTPIAGVPFQTNGTNVDSSVLPIPFLQVLNAGAPVTDLTYGRDVVIF